MAVVPVSSSSTTQNAQRAAPAPQTVDYQSFLKLLVAQAKNQDPTNPTDSTAYLSQLASFSSVEQSLQINQKLERILSTSGLADANSLIGANVTTASGVSGRVVGATIENAAPHLVLSDGRLVPFADGLTITRP